LESRRDLKSTVLAKKLARIHPLAERATETQGSKNGKAGKRVGPMCGYVRVFDPPVDGRVIKGEKGLDVGDTVDVKLLNTNPQMAFIDFGRLRAKGLTPI
jgi:hypothetical protein